MIQPGGRYLLIGVARAVVIGLMAINAGRGEWGLVVNGAILTTGISLLLATLRPRSKP